MADSLEDFATILQVHLLWSGYQISKYRLSSMELSG